MQVYTLNPLWVKKQTRSQDLVISSQHGPFIRYLTKRFDCQTLRIININSIKQPETDVRVSLSLQRDIILLLKSKE